VAVVEDLRRACFSGLAAFVLVGPDAVKPVGERRAFVGVSGSSFVAAFAGGGSGVGALAFEGRD